MAEKTQIELSVIIPLLNEMSILPELYKRLKESVNGITSNHELIFVDDGSSDRTLEILMELSKTDKKTKYISFSRNFGHQVAITSGLEFCSGNANVIIDGDLQDPPELIPELYNKYKEGYEVVYAKRISREGETIAKKLTAKLFYRFLKRITSFEIPVDTGDFRLIDKKIVTYLNQMPERNKYLRGQIAWLGFKQTYVLYEREKRKSGKSGYSIKKMVNLAVDGITSFSNVPLRFVTNMGILVSLLAFIVIIFALFSHFVSGKTIAGWTSLILSITFLGGIQLISIGIIGEYISRINTDVRKRPLYIIDQTNI
ncbi:MAG: glycosyltransferase family 2 protein [Bacteroidales bacterium]|nr:glycosyltransferase family 2 protein [Bacteroidales bacterium]MCF8404142.1 glycosyltransferase family 2 protein [Bacteroidales bacterium]